MIGDLLLNSGTLAIEIGGTDPASFDRIAVDGITTLGGKLGIGAALLRPLPRDAESRALLARMQLDNPRGLRERIYRRLVAASL